MRPFGCPVTILNTLDHLGKFQRKADEGFLVGYSVCSKAFRVFNSRTRIVQETLHVNFLENKPNVAGTMNYHPVSVANQTNSGAGFQDSFDAEKEGEEVTQTYVLFPAWSASSTNPQDIDKDALVDGKEHGVDIQKSVSADIHFLSSKFQDCSKNSSNEVPTASTTVPTVGPNTLNSTNTFSAAGLSNNAVSPTYGDASKFPDDPDMPGLEDIIYSDDEDVVGAEADFNNLEPSVPLKIKVDSHRCLVMTSIPACLLASFHRMNPRGNKKDERRIVIRNKARLLAQGHTQEEGIDYEEVFAPVARIKVIRLFLAYASFMGFMVYQMDVKSAFLYGTTEEEVYVYQPSGFEDPDHPNKVYKVVKALYGLHQAPRAWYETLATYLLKNGLQVKQNKDGIFISQDKYIAEILRKFGLTEGKSTSTLIDTEKPLLKDLDGDDVDMHTYRSMIGSLMYLTSSRPDIMFVVCACAYFQVTPKASHLHAVKRIFRYLNGKPRLGLWYPKDLPFDLVAYSDSDYAVVATSSIEAEYVADASGCAQVLWIQNQLLDYGVFNSPMLYLLRVEMVLNSPCPYWVYKNWLVQKQMALGKETSNPLMVENLPKIV
nr:hypothetical protein [Tanacetum cinerariifolium]